MKTAAPNIEEESSLYKIENDIPRDSRRELATLMNPRLASAVDLQLPLKQAHWNIAGGTARVAAARSRLDEYPLTVAEGLEQANAVSMALANFGHDARLPIDEANALDDADAADLFTEISRGLDHWLWFVGAHAQSPQ